MVGGSSLTKVYSILSSLCGKVGVLQRKAKFSRSATVSVAVKNMGGEFFHPIWRVIGIATNSLSSTSKGKTIPILGESVGRKPMR